jgi:iron complex outermembrane receptor protein
LLRLLQKRAVPLVTCFFALALPAWPQRNTRDLAGESLEDLMNIKVISVARTDTTIARTASAIFIITEKDIRNSGATNIPDLLRMVPGMDVAQIDANTWAISARGLNDRFSNELFVLVDGRSVYTPTFGGAYWDVLDLPLEDIARIEVIRGPGGSVWGENAVNGVINILTKKAAETQGNLAVGGGGNLLQGFSTLQHGGKLGPATEYRIFAKYFNQVQMPGLMGERGADGWHVLRGGFRTDSALSANSTLTFQGDIYQGEEGSPTALLQSVTSPVLRDVELEVPISGGFLQSIWKRTYSARSDTTLQVSLDRYHRNDALNENRNTLSFDFQHHFSWNDRHNLVWGLDYNFSASHSTGVLSVSLSPPKLNLQIFSGFVQDEIRLKADRLYLTLGGKLEHNHYTSFNIMPSGRLAWTPDIHSMLWIAISKADRTPAETDTAARVTFGGFPGADGIPVLEAIIGNPHFKNEVLKAYEAGYRTTILDRFTLDLASYYGDYSHQETTEPVTPFFESTPGPLHLVLPFTNENLSYGEAHGMEMSANWKVTDRWTVSPGYAFEQIHMHLKPQSQDTGSISDAQGSTPVHSAQLRSHLALGNRTELDTNAYFVDRLSEGGVPSYTRLDTGLTWHWTDRLSSSLFGQDLLQDHHLEFVDDSGNTRSTLVKRNVYGKLTWQF